jgi:hypothetical protein
VVSRHRAPGAAPAGTRGSVSRTAASAPNAVAPAGAVQRRSTPVPGAGSARTPRASLNAWYPNGANGGAPAAPCTRADAATSSASTTPVARAEPGPAPAATVSASRTTVRTRSGDSPAAPASSRTTSTSVRTSSRRTTGAGAHVNAAARPGTPAGAFTPPDAGAPAGGSGSGDGASGARRTHAAAATPATPGGSRPAAAAPRARENA